LRHRILCFTTADGCGRSRTTTSGSQNSRKAIYTTDAFSEHAARTIKSFAKGAKPFFVHLCYTAPHFPLHAFPEDIEASIRTVISRCANAATNVRPK
ncbi:MAG: hypothetical protein ACKVHE_22440, partial [Planctomycetales bacterium]